MRSSSGLLRSSCGKLLIFTHKSNAVQIAFPQTCSVSVPVLKNAWPFTQLYRIFKEQQYQYRLLLFSFFAYKPVYRPSASLILRGLVKVYRRSIHRLEAPKAHRLILVGVLEHFPVR